LRKVSLNLIVLIVHQFLLPQPKNRSRAYAAKLSTWHCIAQSCCTE